eukprot:scaffold81897_cov53-Phaeocystis_antarctica.AAC.1
MGIPHLLPFLEDATEQSHISAFRGHKCAIDGYAWLHKASMSCAMEMARGSPTKKFVDYCMKLLYMIKSHGVEPLIVFDGARISAKEGTEEGRQLGRAKARKEAGALLAAGERERAMNAYAKAVDIKPEHAHQLQLAMRAAGFRFFVAPYEADAQLAQLARAGHVSVVVTEDSDLLAFGCPRVLYKMQPDGSGQLITRERMALARAKGGGGGGGGSGPLLFSPWAEWEARLFLT